MPSRKANSTQWPMFISAREYMQICDFFSKFKFSKIVIQCINLSKTSFLNIYLQKMLHRCRRKLHSIKSRDFRVYIGSIDERSPFVYTLVFWVWRNLKSRLTYVYCGNTYQMVGRKPPLRNLPEQPMTQIVFISYFSSDYHLQFNNPSELV